MLKIPILKALSLTRKQVLDQRKSDNEECSEISDVRASENKTENAFIPMMHKYVAENKIVIGLIHVKNIYGQACLIPRACQQFS